MKTINYKINTMDKFYNVFENVILKNIFVNVTGFYNKRMIYINLREPNKDKKMFLVVVNVNMSKGSYINCLHQVKSISIKDQLKINGF